MAHPYRTSTQTVPPEWIDYNGHMNVAYYTMAFDRALDEVFEMLGVGETSAREHRMGPMALQSQLHYLSELFEGERFHADFQILDTDPKRIHFFAVIIKEKDGTRAATYESLSMNVDLEARKSTPYPPASAEKIRAIFEEHKALPRPAEAGRTIGIRRKTAGAA